MAESFLSTLKYEFIDRGSFRRQAEERMGICKLLRLKTPALYL